MKLPIFKKGFTLVEIIIVISIIGLLGTIFIFSFKNFSTNQSIKNTVENTVGIISEARAKTVNGYQGLQYSVHFQSDRVVLFSGSTFDNNNMNNETILFDSGITLNSISMSDGGSQITFNKMNGTASPYGTITMGLNGQSIKTISINSAGSISQN